MSRIGENREYISYNQKADEISVYIEDREYIANKYVMKCFFITMLFYVVSFTLNIFEIFVRCEGVYKTTKLCHIQR